MKKPDTPGYFYLLRVPTKLDGKQHKLKEVLAPGIQTLGELTETQKRFLNTQYWELIHAPALMRLMFQIAYYAHFMDDAEHGQCEVRRIKTWKDWNPTKQHRAISKLESIEVIEVLEAGRGKNPKVRLLDSAPIVVGPEVDPELEKGGRGYYRVCRGQVLWDLIQDPRPHTLHLMVVLALLATKDEKKHKFYFSRSQYATHPGIASESQARAAWESLKALGLVVALPRQDGQRNAACTLPLPAKDAMLFDDRSYTPKSAKKAAMADGKNGNTSTPESEMRLTGLNPLINSGFTTGGEAVNNLKEGGASPEPGQNPATSIIKDPNNQGVLYKKEINTTTQQAAGGISLLNPHPSTLPDPTSTPDSVLHPPSNPESTTLPESKPSADPVRRKAQYLECWEQADDEQRELIVEVCRKIFDNPAGLPKLARWRGQSENRYWNPFFVPPVTPANFPEQFREVMLGLAEGPLYRPSKVHARLYRLLCAEHHLQRLTALLDPFPAWLLKWDGRSDAAVGELVPCVKSKDWEGVRQLLEFQTTERLLDIAIQTVITLLEENLPDEAARLGGRVLVSLEKPHPVLLDLIPGIISHSITYERVHELFGRLWEYREAVNALEVPLRDSDGQPDLKAVRELDDRIFVSDADFRSWLWSGLPVIDWQGLCGVGAGAPVPDQLQWIAESLMETEAEHPLKRYFQECKAGKEGKWGAESTNWRKLLGGDQAPAMARAYADTIGILLEWMHGTSNSGLFPVVTEQGLKLLQQEARWRLAVEIEERNPLTDFLSATGLEMAGHCMQEPGTYLDEMKRLAVILKNSTVFFWGDFVLACERLAAVNHETVRVFLGAYRERCQKIERGAKFWSILQTMTADSRQYAEWVALRKETWKWFERGYDPSIKVLTASPWLELPQDHPARQLLEFRFPGPSAK